MTFSVRSRKIMVIRKLWLFSLIESGHRPKEKCSGRRPKEKCPEWPAPPLVPHVHLSSISGRRGKSLGSGTTRSHRSYGSNGVGHSLVITPVCLGVRVVLV